MCYMMRQCLGTVVKKGKHAAYTKNELYILKRTAYTEIFCVEGNKCKRKTLQIKKCAANTETCYIYGNKCKRKMQHILSHKQKCSRPLGEMLSFHLTLFVFPKRGEPQTAMDTVLFSGQQQTNISVCLFLPFYKGLFPKLSQV